MPEPTPAPLSDPAPELPRTEAPFAWTYIEGVMKEVLEPQGFSMFSPFTEKHGSWEATYYRPAREDKRGLSRFIALDFTNESAPSINGPNIYHVEACEIAEKNECFFRRLVDQLTAKDDEFREQKFKEALTLLLDKAARNVLSLQEHQLNKRYNEHRIGEKLRDE